MNKILSLILISSLLVLSCFASSLGGALLADLTVWRALFVSVVQGLFQRPLRVHLENHPSLSSFHFSFDRFLFLQVNDPLLI